MLTVLLAPGPARAQRPVPQKSTAASPKNYLGFDANEYPGDDLLPALHKQFAFAGYWLTNPPLVDHNPWIGKRSILLRNGFGFLVVANGRLDKEILASRKSGKSPASFGRADAAIVIAAARREGFPPRTILFLDQEEGGGMLPEQAEYLLAWTEAVGDSTYRSGVYASGHPVPNGKGPNGKPQIITTIQDLRALVAAKHLHPISFWVIQDACPPAPGCVVRPASPPAIDLSGTPNAIAWQFAQSPRTSFARACAATYAADNNCYAPGVPNFRIDLSVSNSPDPSHGR
ncbi:MAG: DUF1906 domain-containing protein [Acidobacteriota bacterium]|nr:DUF1906 domain-containing protein [Acidobacteriota bacterium]